MKRFKRTGALLLAVLLLCGVATQCFPRLQADALTFTPRLEAPEKTNGYYYSGNLFWRCGYGMPNCTCYAFGRAYEIMGTVPRLSHGNANSWYDYNVKKGYYGYGAVAKPGAIACWTVGTYGHVAVVETVNEDGTLTISESHWSGTYFDTKTVDALCSCYAGFQGFIYIDEPDGRAPINETAILRDFGQRVTAAIYHRDSGKNITVDENNNVCLSETNDPTDLHQLWYFTKEESPTGAYQIVNAASGKCLQAKLEEGETLTGIRVAADNDTPAQRWYLENAGGIRPVYSSGPVMDLAGGSTEGGTDVRLYASNGTAAQKWGLRIVPALIGTINDNGHTYELYQGDVSWEEADAFARERGGHLVTVTTAAEQTAVNTLLPSDMTGVWIGATDEEKEGKWQWVTGEPFAYAKWNPTGEPNNQGGNEHFAHIFCASGYWNDVTNESAVVDGLIVEYETEKPAVPTGICAKATAENTLSVTWDKVEDAVQYNLYRFDDAKADYALIGIVPDEEGKAPVFIDSHLTAGMVYFYKVAAVKAAGSDLVASERSDGTCAQAVPKPASPKNVKAKVTGVDKVTLSWDAVPGATQYYIYYHSPSRTDDAFRGTVFTTGAAPTQFTDAYPKDSGVYEYKVLAVTVIDGCTLASGKSEAAKVTIA